MKRELWLIFLVVFIDLVGFGIVIPTLPFIDERFGADPTQIGILFASYSFFQFLGSPVLGRLSDKYGRKRLLSLSLLGSSFGFFLIAGAKSLPLVFASRIIDGITGGNISVAQAYIADVTEGRERTKAMGLVGAAFGLGFMFGPLIGGVLSTYGFATPYVFAGFLALANAVLIILVLPESEKKTVQQRVRNMFSIEVLREILRPKIVLHLTILFFVVIFAFSLMQGILPLYSNRLFMWDERANGYFFSYIGLVSVFAQLVLLRKLVDRYAERKIIATAIFVLALGFLVLTVARMPVIFYAGGTLLALSFGMLLASLQAEISHYSDPEEQGIVMGTVQGLNALARTFGPAVGGFLFGSFVIRMPFFLSSVILFAAGVFSIVIYRKSKS